MDATTTPREAGRDDQGPQDSLAGAGEFGLVDLAVAGLVMPPAVRVGPGDDAAVFAVEGEAVVSTDLLVEGVHFRREWSSAEDVGRKLVAVNVADLEAMGALPVSLVVALGIPGDVDTAWVRGFSAGVRAEASRAGITLVGGDTTGAAVVTCCATVIGSTAGVAPVLRSGARPGQVVAVRGELGWAAAGLAALQHASSASPEAVQRQRAPQVPYGAGRQAALAGAGAMLDVSDGLLADLGHVVRASGVVAELDSACAEADEPVRLVAEALGRDPLEFVLAGGEDHALAACFDPGRVPPRWRVLGRVRALRPGEEPTVLVDGRAWHGSRGWDHFRG